MAACSTETRAGTRRAVGRARRPGYDIAAATARTSAVTFPGGTGECRAVTPPPPATPAGAVLVVHENKGLTDHIRAVTGRLAGDGYAALAPDLLSRVGGTAAAPDATAALGGITAPISSPT